VADTYKNFAELAANHVEGTDFIVSGENLRDDIGVTAYHGGGIEIGTTELLRSVRSLKPDWSWYSFEALLSSNNSVLHITSTNYDEPRGLTFVKRLNRVVSLHGASGDVPVTYIGGRDIVMRDFIWKALTDRGFTVELANGGIAGIEQDNFINLTKSGEGVQLELSTQQRKNFFIGGDWSRAKRTDPANWTQDMVNYTAAILEGTEKALALKVLGQGSISLVNMNDTLSGGTAPTNPSEGFLWVDSSGSKKMLKQWTNGAWVDLGELDADLSGSLADINQTISDMISDSVIDYQERQQQKDLITDVIGYIIGDTTQSMPTVAYLDSNNKGEFYTIRKSAQMAGISTSDAKYTDLATKYNDLKSYLDGLQPIKVWDLSLVNKDLNITVEKNTLRTKWLQYKLAVAALDEAIATKLKQTIDNVEVGGANLLNDTSFVTAPILWNGATCEIIPSSTAGVPNSLKVYKLPANNSYGFSLFGKETLQAGKDYTVSFEVKLDASVDFVNYLYLRGDNIQNTHLGNQPVDVTKAGSFQRFTFTFKPSTDVVNGGILVGFASPYVTSFEIRKVQLEKGNRASDWSLSNADITNGINDVNGKLDNLVIGTRNLIRNSTFNITDDSGALTSWINVNSRWVIDPPEDDDPDSSILRATATGNTSDANYYLQSNTFNAKKGEVFTFSLDFKVKDVAAWDSQQVPFICEFFDSTGRLQYTYGTLERMKITNMQSGVWYRGTYTTTVVTDNVSYGRIKIILFRNGELSIRKVQVERGMKATDYKAAPEDMINQVSVVEQRLATIEQTTTDDAIVNKVISSNQYTLDMNKKADADALGSYTTQDALEEALAGVASDIDQKIQGIDFTPYVKQADLEHTAEEITAKFQKSGGINMLKNSVGFASTDYWEKTTGSIQTLQNEELSSLGFDSGFYSPEGSSVVMTQSVYTTIGQVYTFTYYLKKMTNSGTSSHAGIDLLDQTGAALTWMGRGSNQGVSNGFERITYTFTATTTIHTIRLTIGTGAEAIATGMMFNIGEVPLQWSLSSGELYNGNVQTNINGVKVNRVENGVEVGYSVMRSDKFAGYYDMDNSGTIDETPNSPDEVYRVDKDEFVQKKAVVKEEITMGTIKVVKINSTASRGWAFVSNAE
jgi:phage replication-related protein YjqB (UPF0714/DUF867 family)